MSRLTCITLLFGALANVAFGEVKVGNFANYAHGISGDVFVKDEKTLVIKGFTYDGAGPDAFFWVGTSDKPDSVGTILPYPFEGQFYHYEDRSAPILDRRFDNEEITLTIPDDVKMSDLKWMSVWCRQFAVNFGDVYFPADLKMDEEDVAIEQEEGSIPEDLPPPLIEPVHNAHDPNRHDEDWKDDSDAYSEPESESEAETEPYSSASSLSASIVLVILGAYLC